jgi:hypothetical protein
MAERKSKSKTKEPSNDKYRQARITTKTADEMHAALKGRSVELVGRGPRRMPDETFVAEVIGTKAELEKVKKSRCKIEIRSRRKIKEPEKQVSKTNRYAKKGAIPKGLGVKK